jgi:hypothetical protein
VPASLTQENFHILRLSAVPVFLITLTIPALKYLTYEPGKTKQALIAVAVLLMCGQAVYFQFVNERSGRELFRQNMFDADYERTIFPTALTASKGNPIYIQDAPAIPGYIQAKWYATLEHLPLERFVFVPPDARVPENAIVISTEAACSACEVLFERSPYRVYRVSSRAP